MLYWASEEKKDEDRERLPVVHTMRHNVRKPKFKSHTLRATCGWAFYVSFPSLIFLSPHADTDICLVEGVLHEMEWSVKVASLLPAQNHKF